MTLAATLYEYVLGVHIIAIVLAFGWTFALPFMFALAVKQDPRSIPLLHRIEVRVSRLLLNPALVLILAAGIYLASDGHLWKEFFVQWGLAAVVVIGGVVGAVMIPTAERSAELAEADLQSYTGGEFTPGEAYRAQARRLTIAGSGLWLLVLATIVIMAVKP
jgi:uncharacterized membrane protein